MEGPTFHLTLNDLPTEILLHVFSFLRIPDLLRVEKVSSRLARLIARTNVDNCNLIWARASTEGVSVNQRNIKHLERGARFGNKEALIKLAVAYLYSEGVPDGAGRGTESAENGIKAAEYLMQLESIPNVHNPFSWVLIRPPFSKHFVCCKACVCNQMKLKYSSNETCSNSLAYVIGKVLSFHQESSLSNTSLEWFKKGSEQGSLSCSYEYWAAFRKSEASHADIASIRELRQIATDSTTIDAKFELCRQYARGHFGGLSRTLAMSYIKQIMSTSPPILADKMYKVQHKINRYMMLVLVDWLVEVSEMKLFSSRTIHLTIQLIQRYLLKRYLSRARVQLLGITALLVAARWTDVMVLTIREAASITDDTYTYQDVVNMMADLIAALKGDMMLPVPSDYIQILQLLSSSSDRAVHLASYIAETCIIHLEFGRYSTAQYSAACLLLSRILLNTDFPWSNELVEATGMDVTNLRDIAVSLYTKCFNDDVVVDYRGEKLNAIPLRYAEERYNSVSEIKVMSLTELKECLGMSLPDSKHRLFSFLNDSQYRSDEDSVVDQSFIQEFNSHFITEPPLQQHSSPLLSSFTHSVSDPVNTRDITVSPISSVGLSSSSNIDTRPHTTTACSSPLTGLSSSSSSAGSFEGPSSSRVPLAGIMPLYSEETMGCDPKINHHVLVRSKKNVKVQSNKENCCISTHSKSLVHSNVVHNQFEKRSTFDQDQSSKCKRRRSS